MTSILKIDYLRDSNFTEAAKATLADRYARGEEKLPSEILARASLAFASNKAHAERLYNYAMNQWFGYASPIISNAPTRTKFTDDFKSNFSRQCYEDVTGALPISCFTGQVPDSRIGIADHYTEQMWLLSNGGGYAADWSLLRPINSKTATGSKTGGVIPFYHVTDGLTLATHQGNNRRGIYDGHLRVNHPEIVQFIESRKMSGDPNKRSRNVFQTVNLSDEFMYAVIKDEMWDLTDHYGVAVSSVRARYLWELMLETPFETGCPFLHWEGNSNAGLPKEQQALGLRVNNLNICTEITLATDKDRTAVCCLSSPNAAKYDEWRDDPQFIPDLVEFLDNVLEFFIQNAIYSCTKDYDWNKLKEVICEVLPDITAELLDDLTKALVERCIMGMRKAVYSAKRERAIGIGLMGLDTHFLSKNIAYESKEALVITHDIFTNLKTKAVKASLALGTRRGEAPDMAGTGRRNSHLLAVAPTATNSTIAGEVSPAMEKKFKNIYPMKTKSGTFLIIEPKLQELLDKYQQNTPEVIKSIRDAKGSVQHLSFLSDHERKMLRTGAEVDQMWVVEHAIIAQREVCQAISVNLNFKPKAPRAYVNAVHFRMWQGGLKSRYYVRTEAGATGDAFADDIELKETIDYSRYNAPAKFEVCYACE